MNHPHEKDINELGGVLLEAGVNLLSSGASCARIRLTMKRLAASFKYTAHISIAPKSVSLTLNNEADALVFNGMRSITAQGVNFKTISGISRLSWDVLEKQYSIQQVRDELDRLMALPHYPRLVILFFVSLAGSGFCFSFGGKLPEMVIAFGATCCGLFVRQEAVKHRFNPFICVYIGSLVASLFAGAFIKAGLNINFEHAFATSVLFLIPGVPLINCFTDLIDGNTLNGIVRGINAVMFALAIALGLLTTMFIYNLK
ncbi:threonine/serine exporter family protein [Ferruginibacter paludis]|uniref:threonine/serine ThrE exporter family protein n=1 Tax=Ferruginibacter paludis TaxID=1310417 RepID=UPI0025B58C67|nr:threonine/serine exporter family protein [Ferruginibacter paludis]MDN3655952.1 threonine/serine exporter family protein [Ferruginibacter paludis]